MSVRIKMLTFHHRALSNINTFSNYYQKKNPYLFEFIPYGQRLIFTNATEENIVNMSWNINEIKHENSCLSTPMHAQHRLLRLKVILLSVFFSNCLIRFTKKRQWKNNYVFTFTILSIINIQLLHKLIMCRLPQQLFVVCQKEEEVELLLGQKWRLHYQMELEQVLTLSHPRGLELTPTV